MRIAVSIHDIDERKAVMNAAMEVANGEVPVLTSIQHTDFRVIVELANLAYETGVVGVQLAPAYYYESTESGAYRIFELVSNESGVSIMIYHTWWEGLTMSLDLLNDLADIETVRALKWASPDADHYRNGLIAFADRLVCIDNSGQQILSRIMGARGFITHLSGFWPQYPAEIWQLLEKHDYEAARQRLADFKWKWTEWRSKVYAITGGEGPFIKSAMETVGLTAAPPRPPSIQPPQHLLDELEVLLDECGVPRVGMQKRLRHRRGLMPTPRPYLEWRRMLFTSTWRGKHCGHSPNLKCSGLGKSLSPV